MNVRRTEFLVVAERVRHWSVELTVTCTVAARALRLLGWTRTASVLSKGSGFFVLASPIYLQLAGGSHFEQLAHRFDSDRRREAMLLDCAGGRRWQELERWAAACGYLNPFPLPDAAKLHRKWANSDQGNSEEMDTHKEALRKAMEKWSQLDRLTPERKQVIGNIRNGTLLALAAFFLS